RCARHSERTREESPRPSEHRLEIPRFARNDGDVANLALTSLSAAIAFSSSDLPGLLQRLRTEAASASGDGGHRLHNRVSDVSSAAPPRRDPVARGRADALASRRRDLRRALWIETSRVARIAQ